MIGQAIRYGVRYVVEHVLLADYEHGVIFKIPEDLHTKSNIDIDDELPVLEVAWTFVGRDQLRWAVAASFWKACRAVTISMEDLNRDAQANKVVVEQGD